jgi:diguanylate cyclase (GGDEF)-like protein
MRCDDAISVTHEWADRQVSGLYTNILLDTLEQRLPPRAVRDILASAGETRSIEELKDFSSWSSHDQFRRLLKEALKVIGTLTAKLEDDSLNAFTTSNPEMAETIQALGSPGAVLALNAGANPMIPGRRYETSELAPTQWTIREWFTDGVIPYPEFCVFVAFQYSLIPRYFGLASAAVVETECQCRGDDACLFEISWSTEDPSVEQSGFYKVRAELLEARLHQLEAMVTDLASNDRYEEVLQGVVRSSQRAVGAVGVLLAVEARDGRARKVYFEGLSRSEAEVLATDLLGGGARSDITAVEVASSRARYGVLACDQLGGVFASQSLPTLETYGRLAAATLDSASAIDNARHQAETAEVLLDLASSLAEIVSVESMASKLADALPALIDCDRVAIFLDQSGSQGTPVGEYRIVASRGYSDLQLQVLSSRSFSHTEYPDRTEESGIERSLLSTVGNAAAIAIDITSAGQKIGWISAAVTSHPDRLLVTPRMAVRLKGLAGQASIAFSNANLVDQIRFKSLHDPLTGLPNRALLLDRIEQMTARARRSAVQTGVLFVDLDGFKEVNDTLGHGAGDQLLQEVAERLSTAMRGGDSVGRLGGDEFVVVVDGSSLDVGPELVAERLLAILREPFTVGDSGAQPLRLTASIGVALGLRESASDLLRDADTALYEAKAAGRNCFVSFQPEMHTAVQDRLLLEMDLRDALRLNQYFLMYQPIFNLASGAITGVEALLRWRHPDRGLVLPSNFIPLLETSGMIVDVGIWVLEQACRQGAEWRSLGYQLDISVNVSARQLEAGRFVEDLERALQLSRLDPKTLIIEITETAIMRDVEAVIPRLEELKALGIRIAIDDFGTGYSSLASLQRFPVDTIKIDRSFIASMADSPGSGAMIHTLVQLGKALGLETLAEGIEESGQYSTLEDECCDSGQGYLVARPMEAGAIPPFLAEQPSNVGSSPGPSRRI